MLLSLASLFLDKSFSNSLIVFHFNDYKYLYKYKKPCILLLQYCLYYDLGAYYNNPIFKLITYHDVVSSSRCRAHFGFASRQ